jgi:hypothetical protein
MLWAGGSLELSVAGSIYLIAIDISIARLRKLLFGSKTERTRDAAHGRSESSRPSTNETTPPDE